MDLVVYQMVEFEHVHVSDCYRAVEIFTGAPVSESQLSCLRIAFFFEHLDYVFFSGSVKYRGRDVPALGLGRQPEVNLKHLSYVHS